MSLTKLLDAARTPAEEALERALVTGNDLLRLKTIARLHARGLPPAIGWTDLLHEAIARVLDGSRRQPEGVPLVAFLAGVMRSIRAEQWRRTRREAGKVPEPGAGLGAPDTESGEAPDPAPSVERCIQAVQQLARIDRLFADDLAAQQVIAGLADERSPEEICVIYGMTKTEYDSTRRRIRRVLLREGLRSMQP